jgi:hypothetical protein
VIPKLYDGHNRSFFFVSYARSSLRQGLSLPLYVPTDAMRQGDFGGLADGSTGKPFILYDPNTSLNRTANYQRTPFPNNQIPLTRRSPFAAAVFALEPKPTSQDNPFIASNLTTVAPSSSTTPTVTFRLDHQISKKDTAYLRFSHTNSTSYTISGAGFGGSSPYSGPVMADGAANLNLAATNQYSAALSFTHIFSSTFFAETTLGNQWQGDTNGGAGPQSVNYATQFGLPNPFNQLAFPQIIGTTAQAVGVGNQQGSILAAFAYGTIRRNSQIVTNLDENLTKLAGRHQLQFGGRYRHERIGIFPDQYPSCAASFSGNGTALVSSGSIASGSYTPVGYTGLAIADLYIGSAQSYTTYLNQGYYHFRDQEIATYFQDDIRVTPKLVLNLGLRWEIHPAVHERDRVLTTFDIANKAMVLGEPLSYYYASGATTPEIVKSLQNIGAKFESAEAAGLPSGILKNNFFTFSPRVGAAYRLFGARHSTVLRAGFGNYIYPPAVRNFYSNTRKNVPFTEAYTQNYNNAAQSPDGIANYLVRQPQAVVAGLNSANAVNTSVLPPGITASGFAADYPVTYVQQYNMTIEQRLKPSAVLRVTYLFVHGQNLEQYREYNSSPSNYVYFTRTGKPLGTGPTSSIAQNLYDNTTYSTVEVQQKTGYSNNSSLQVNFQRLYTKGLAFQAYYTLSSAMRAGGNGWRDSMISPLGIYLDGQGPATLDAANRLVNYLRDTGIPQHRVRANGILDIPVGRGKRFLSKSNRFVDQFVGGWQVAGTFTVNSQMFALSTTNWGAINPTVTYGDSVPVQDCRSGVCYKAYLYFNGYISPNLINNPKNGIMGIPDNYVANLAPLNPASGTNTVSVKLQDGTMVNNVTYAPGPGLHPYNKAFIKGPFNWNSDASFFKVFPITEKWKLRFSADFFNVFNHQGSINPDSATGIQSTRSSYNNARQFQVSGRILF